MASINIIQDFMIKVSVIIPVYNVEKYLGECLDSILEQTLKEIEIICINDGSSDSSLKILNRYDEKYANLEVLSQKNSGVGSARNLGIKRSKGEYLMFVDPDDYLAENDVLEILYDTVKIHGVLACGGSVIANKNGVIVEGRRETEGKVECGGLFFFRKYPWAANGHTRYIIKRELINKHNILYPQYCVGEDMLFITEVLNAANKFYLVEKDVYVYRKEHKETKYTEQRVEDYVCSLYNVLKIAVENNIKELFDYRIGTLNQIVETYGWYKFLLKSDKWDAIVSLNQLINKGNAAFGYQKNLNCLMNKGEYINYLNEMGEKWREIEKCISKHDNIVIYGAGKFGKQVYRYLRKRGYIPYCFCVTDAKKNEKTIDGIQVVAFDRLCNEKDYMFLLCVLNQTDRKQIKEQLETAGYEDIIDYNVGILNYEL